jgi:hypothetical protein
LPPRIREAKHRNGGFFMRLRLESVETGRRLEEKVLGSYSTKSVKAVVFIDLNGSLVQRLLMYFTLPVINK